MKINGDPKYSNKFYVYLEDGSIKWTADFETAKFYVNNFRYKDWYNKDLYCTNEEIVKGYDGKFYLKQRCPKDPNEIIKYDNKTQFVKNCLDYLHNELDNIVKSLNFDSFLDAYSWKDSKIKKYKEQSLSIIKYRDLIHEHYLNILTKHNDLLEKTDELLDLSNVYDEFIKDFPKYEGTN